MTNTICPTCGQELPTVSDTFGSRLEQARVSREMSRQDLAELLGYQRTSIITRWETGQLTPTDIPVVESVAMAVNVTPAWLLYGVQEPSLFDSPAPDPAYPPEEDDTDGYELSGFDQDQGLEPDPAQHESPGEIIARIRMEKLKAARAERAAKVVVDESEEG